MADGSITYSILNHLQETLVEGTLSPFYDVSTSSYASEAFYGLHPANPHFVYTSIRLVADDGTNIDAKGSLLEDSMGSGPYANEHQVITPVAAFVGERPQLAMPAVTFDGNNGTADFYYYTYVTVDSAGAGGSGFATFNDEIDYDFSGDTTASVTSVPEVPTDTGSTAADAIARWWNEGGGVDISNGRAASFLYAEADDHQAQQDSLAQVAVYLDPAMLASSSLYLSEGLQADVDAFLDRLRPPLKALLESDFNGDSVDKLDREAAALTTQSKSFEQQLLSDARAESDNQIASIYDNVSSLKDGDPKKIALDLINVGTAGLAAEADNARYEGVDRFGSGVISAVGLAVAARQVQSDDQSVHDEGVAGLFSNTGQLIKAVAPVTGDGAASVGILLANAVQIGSAYDSGDPYKLATALAKGATVFAFTAIGELEGNPDALASVGQTVANSADLLGKQIANSDTFTKFLDNNEDLLNAYNRGGFEGLDAAAFRKVYNNLPAPAQLIIDEVRTLHPGLNLFYGLTLGSHAFGQN